MILTVEDVSLCYGSTQVLYNCSLHCPLAQTTGILGVSGSGKTSLVRAIALLTPLAQGKIFFQGKDIHKLSRTERQLFRSQLQITFQDPHACFNPLYTIAWHLQEVCSIHHAHEKNHSEHIDQVLDMVHLNRSICTKYPHELSGGQKQRIIFARALLCSPRMIVLDEPFSSLDLPLRKKMYALLSSLQQSMSLSFLCISHDLDSLYQVAQHIAIMHEGSILEQGSVEEIFQRPQHPYTKRMIHR